MSKNYGTMMGYNDAIGWVDALEVPDSEAERKKRVLARMQYERDKTQPVKPKLRIGRSFDEIYCGNCAYLLAEGENYEYCPRCGFAIDWQALKKERAERTQKARNT